MTTTKSRMANPEIGIAGPKTDDWISITANVLKTVRFSAVHKSGFFFTDERTIDERSIDILEYAHAKSHTHQLGGDVAMDAIAKEFYENPHVENVYTKKSGDEILVYLVVDEYFDNMAIELTKLERKISKNHSNADIDLMYTTKDCFSKDGIPVGSSLVPRR